MHVFSFPAIADSRAEVLILGSMPGNASLAANQYYAHPRNLFWPLMAEVLGIAHEENYDERCRLLIEHHIALWDVLKTCVRQGSLDADIKAASIETNDFVGFFRKHPSIHTVFFNGQKAQQVFSSRVAPFLEKPMQTLCLPSTSPANAGAPYAVKLELWQSIKTVKMPNP